MGLGARAGATGTSALAYNTANLPVGNLYHIEASSALVAGDNSWVLGTAVVDSASNKLAVGTSFRGVLGDGDRQYKGWDWRAGFGIAFLKQLSVGASIRWANLKPRRSNGQPLGPRLKGVTMDTAIRVSPTPWLHIAGLGYNLIETHSDLAPRTLGGSAAVQIGKSIEIGTDLLADLSTFKDAELLAGVGFQYVAKERVQLRFGYRRDGGRKINALTQGLGYVSPKISADFSVLQELNQGKETILLLAIRYHVQ